MGLAFPAAILSPSYQILQDLSQAGPPQNLLMMLRFCWLHGRSLLFYPKVHLDFVLLQLLTVVQIPYQLFVNKDYWLILNKPIQIWIGLFKISQLHRNNSRPLSNINWTYCSYCICCSFRKILDTFI